MSRVLSCDTESAFKDLSREEKLGIDGFVRLLNDPIKVTGSSYDFDFKLIPPFLDNALRLVFPAWLTETQVVFLQSIDFCFMLASAWSFRALMTANRGLLPKLVCFRAGI